MAFAVAAVAILWSARDAEVPFPQREATTNHCAHVIVHNACAEWRAYDPQPSMRQALDGQLLVPKSPSSGHYICGAFRSSTLDTYLEPAHFHIITGGSMCRITSKDSTRVIYAYLYDRHFDDQIGENENESGPETVNGRRVLILLPTRYNRSTTYRVEVPGSSWTIAISVGMNDPKAEIPPGAEAFGDRLVAELA